jgi:hypothetical protein
VIFREITSRFTTFSNPRAVRVPRFHSGFECPAIRDALVTDQEFETQQALLLEISQRRLMGSSKNY